MELDPRYAFIVDTICLSCVEIIQKFAWYERETLEFIFYSVSRSQIRLGYESMSWLKKIYLLSYDINEDKSCEHSTLNFPLMFCTIFLFVVKDTRRAYKYKVWISAFTRIAQVEC